MFKSFRQKLSIKSDFGSFFVSLQSIITLNLNQMKTNVQLKLLSFIIPVFVIFLAVSLSNCKGHVEIFGITDSVENCSAPYVVYFYPDAEHRTKDLEYTWDFGDNTNSHDQEPVHIYQEEGIYKVILSIKQNKSFDSKSITLYLTADSTAAYSDFDYASYSDSLWAPANVEFQNYSKHTTSFLWEFGDGDTSTVKNPTHVFESQGTYTCLLNAICNSDTSKFSRQMIIKPAPHKIDIFDVTVWMPDSYINSDINIDIYYNGHLDAWPGISKISGFPKTFEVGETLFLFDGVYNSDELVYKIYSSYGDGTAEATFVIKSRDLQLDYYPTLLYFDDLEGIKLESAIGYRQ